ncbi:MAG: hypothetical protein KGJ13_11960 [Patescibacteria group bacterium]|nr:hypothetical protein [Patescibacteria group bacterium]
MIDLMRALVGLTVGGVIGLGFGLIQNAALRRHEKLQQGGRFRNGWAIMPGSMRRIAYLLIALVAVQVLCPLLFVGASQWWISAGVIIGYGWVLFRQLLRQRKVSHPIH